MGCKKRTEERRRKGCLRLAVSFFGLKKEKETKEEELEGWRSLNEKKGEEGHCFEKEKGEEIAKQ